VTGGSDGHLRWWNGRDLSLRCDISVSGAKPVLNVCFLGTTLVSAVLDDGSLEVWDLLENRRVSSIADIVVSAQCRVPSAHGPVMLLCGCQDGQVVLLDPLTGEVLERRLHRDKETVHAVASVSGTAHTLRCVSADQDGSIYKWEPLSNDAGQLLRGFSGKLQFVTDLKVNGIQTVTAGGYDGNIFFWGADTGELLGSIPLGIPVLSATGVQEFDARMLVGTLKGVMCIDLDKAFLDH
jgi:WD40 repeat protein